MAEGQVGMLTEVCLDLVPVSFVIAHLFAGRAYRNQISERIDIINRFPQLQDKLLVDLQIPI